MTTIMDSIKLGEVISFVRKTDDKDVEIYYDAAENRWYLATADREEYIMIGDDDDLKTLYGTLHHIVNNLPWD